jgi:hypothetical protein
MVNPSSPVPDENRLRPNSSSNRADTAARPRPVWVSAVLLAALVVALNAWTTRHLGWGLENAFGITSIAAGLGLAATLGEKLLPEEERGALRISLARIPMAVVAGLWIVFGAIAATRSSIVVFSDAKENSLSKEGVILTRADSGTSIPPAARSGKDEPVRFEVPTSPFGRSYRLKVPGYIEQIVEVQPLTGLTVVPERDLRVSPSVLFRPPPSALQELSPGSGGKFQILELAGKTLQPLAVSCEKSSFLLGREQEIPSSWPELWKLELDVSGVTAVSAMTSAALLGWHHYTPLQPPRDLSPNMVLEARVISGGNAIIARTRVRLRTEPLIDVPLVAETTPKALPPKEVPACPAAE